MEHAGIEITRENYIALNWMKVPDEWNVECEMQLPPELREFDDEGGWCSKKIIAGNRPRQGPSRQCRPPRRDRPTSCDGASPKRPCQPRRRPLFIRGSKNPPIIH